FERPNYLNSKIHVHRHLTIGWMVIKKDVVTIGAEPRSTPQEFPNLIECRTPGLRNFVDPNLATDGSDLTSRNALNRNLRLHGGVKHSKTDRRLPGFSSACLSINS